MNFAAEKKTRLNMGLVFLVSFLDFLTFSAIIPFIPLFFLDSSCTLFPLGISLQTRVVLLGFLYAVYPLAQVVSTPALGKFSDKYGRKKVLLIAYLGNALGYLICALGLVFGSIIPLFIGNLIAGLTGANISTLNAIISDQAQDKKRSQYFGISHLLIGLGFALGPYFSGKLFTHVAFLPALSFYLFIACALVSMLNFLVVYGFLEEKQKPKASPQVSLRELFANRKEIKIVMGVLFFVVFGWYYFIKIFQVFLIEGIKLSEFDVFNILSYYGLCTIVSQSLFVLILHKYIRSKNFMLFFICLLAGSLFALSLVKSLSGVFVIVALFSFAYAMLSPALTFWISEMSPENRYGKTMGAQQSITALAKIIAPILAACTLVISPSIAIGTSAFFVFLSGALFFWYRTTLQLSRSSL